MADAPAPETTTLRSARRLPKISAALRSAAPEMMAVPCWSSWKTGMFMRARSPASISKHSGALRSSRLMPPNVGSRAATASMKTWLSLASTSMSKTSMSANFLNRQALPSMTGLPASGPMLPSPSTAVPLVMTATRLPRAVYSHTSSGFSAMARQGSATPGEYASDRSRCVTRGLVGTTSSFPGLPIR
jgi:hypothetical protein